MSDRTTGCLVAVGITAVIGAFVINSGVSNYYNDRWRVCTVTGKDRGYASDGSSNYRIYTADCGVFADKDAWLRGKTNSADIFGQIQPGKTYRVHVVGARFGLGSHFPNILAVQAAK
jgi:hypothetical protein